MYFRVLGPVHLEFPTGRAHGHVNGSSVRLRGRRQQTILALLAASLGEVVSIERIIDSVWPDAEPPLTCRKQVQNCTAAVRRAIQSLETGSASKEVAILSEPGGYRLVAPHSSVDAYFFEARVRDVLQHVAGRMSDAERRTALAEALKLWFGSPFAGIESAELRAEGDRLEELRMLAIEETVRLDLKDSHTPALHAADLFALTQRHPYRERLWLLHMDALRLSGRSAEALARYNVYRDKIVEELGVEPSQRMKEKQREILRDDQVLAVSLWSDPCA